MMSYMLAPGRYACMNSKPATGRANCKDVLFRKIEAVTSRIQSSINENTTLDAWCFDFDFPRSQSDLAELFTLESSNTLIRSSLCSDNLNGTTRLGDLFLCGLASACYGKL